MAKVKSPLMCQEARGAVGGFEFRQSQFGAIVGRRSITPHRRTESQLTHRALLTAASKAWNLLPENTKSAWIQYATPPQDGRTAWIQAYIRLSHFGFPPASEPEHISRPITWHSVEIQEAYSDLLLVHIQSVFDITGSATVLVYAASTFSHRKEYTHSRMPFSLAVNPIETDIYIPVKMVSPVVHVKLVQIDDFNASVVSSVMLSAEPTWITV